MDNTLEINKPQIDIQEVKRLYTEDMKKSTNVDFKDYCRELEILFEIVY